MYHWEENRALTNRERARLQTFPDVDADYSQIELRLLAHISGDETMREAFLSGEDFHAVTASKVFGVPLEQVTATLRSRAKAVNFGIVYGISAFSLSQDIGVFPNEAKAYMDALPISSGKYGCRAQILSTQGHNRFKSSLHQGPQS